MGGLNLTYRWSQGRKWVFLLSGGYDSDVCVSNEDPPLDYYLIYSGISVVITWRCQPACGYVDPASDRHYWFNPPRPPAEQVKSYTLTGKADDTGSCNVGDEVRSAATGLRVYDPYAVGPPIHGIIDKTCVGTSASVVCTTFTKTATYRWTDQFVGGDLFRVSAYDVYDFDKFENGADPLNWNDDPVNDLANPQLHEGAYLWTGTVGGPFGWDDRYWIYYYCPNVAAAIPDTIHLRIDDNTSPEYADDPPTSDSVNIVIFEDDLERDVANQVALNTHVSGGAIYACWGGATHAYDGTDRWQSPPWEGHPATTYTVIFKADKAAPDGEEDVPLQTSNLQRRDVLVLTGYCHHTNTCMSGTTAVWECNGPINPHQWGTAALEAFIALRTADDERVVWEIRRYPFCGP